MTQILLLSKHQSCKQQAYNCLPLMSPKTQRLRHIRPSRDLSTAMLLILWLSSNCGEWPLEIIPDIADLQALPQQEQFSSLALECCTYCMQLADVEIMNDLWPIYEARREFFSSDVSICAFHSGIELLNCWIETSSDFEGGTWACSKNMCVVWILMTWVRLLASDFECAEHEQCLQCCVWSFDRKGLEFLRSVASVLCDAMVLAVLCCILLIKWLVLSYWIVSGGSHVYTSLVPGPRGCCSRASVRRVVHARRGIAWV